jgi:hypothetical protein
VALSWRKPKEAPRSPRKVSITCGGILNCCSAAGAEPAALLLKCTYNGKRVEANMQHEVVSREEWLERRVELLDQEKALTRLRDLVTAERLRLPWVRVEKEYVFDGPMEN